MRKVLANLDRRWVSAASQQLCSRLSAWLDSGIGKEISHILAFSSFFPGEVDLSAFIGAQMGKRRIYLPRVHADRTMTFLRIRENWIDSSSIGLFGIRQPEEIGGLGEDDRFDPGWARHAVVIVPGLAFDLDGNRIGRGKGYYNTFLRAPMTEALKIGVCWGIQVIPGVASEADHVMMDWICDEESVQQTSAGALEL